MRIFCSSEKSQKNASLNQSTKPVVPKRTLFLEALLLLGRPSLYENYYLLNLRSASV